MKANADDMIKTVAGILIAILAILLLLLMLLIRRRRKSNLDDPETISMNEKHLE